MPLPYQIRPIALTFQAPAAIIRRDDGPPAVRTMPDPTVPKPGEQRVNRRAKIAKPLRVRPSEPRDDHFEDSPISVNASRTGIFFHTRRASYYKGMRVFVTFPYSSPNDPMNCEYIGEIVRIEKLANGKFGVAVHLSMTVNFSSGGPRRPAPGM